MQTIGVSMIIKDEPIDRLVTLIDILRPLVSQYVIADTGSETYEDDKPLLEKAGALVYQIDWRNDFAWARNTTLERLTTDWVLHLDADEMPSYEFLQFLDRLQREDMLMDTRTLGFLVFTRNYWAGDWGIEVAAHWHCRLFRNGRGRWYKPLHEQVALDGREEPHTRDSYIMPKIGKHERIIHSKPREKMSVSAELYKKMEG